MTPDTLMHSFARVFVYINPRAPISLSLLSAVVARVLPTNENHFRARTRSWVRAPQWVECLLFACIKPLISFDIRIVDTPIYLLVVLVRFYDA